jgi:hypothetical protein
VRFFMGIAAYDKPIADALGIPEVGVQFAMVLIMLIIIATSLLGVAYCTSTKDTPQYRPFFREFADRPHAD